MSKAVLIIIKPEWCSLIAIGKKTVEVRKTKPKIDTPFKCYIYCTKSPKGWFFMNSPDVRRDGKVIGEFICDDIRKFAIDPKYDNITLISMSKRSCLSKSQLEDYCSGYWLYGWHISDLKIYDKPKELSEFRVPCAKYERDNPRCGNCRYYYSESNEAVGFYDECRCDGLKYLEKPPQSWCYVEEREENG